MEFILYLQQNTIVFLTLVAIICLMFGSFLNVIIYRLPLMMQKEWRQDCIEFLELPAEAKKDETFNLAFPHSHCPHCKIPIKLWQNIPVIGYLLLRGRCSECQEKISVRYPMVEILTALLPIVIAVYFGFSAQAIFGILFTMGLISISMIDFDHQFIPDTITLPLLWVGLLLNLNGVFTTIEAAIYGAVAGYLVLWIFAKAFEFITGRVGMGHGDFKLFAMFGAWMGWYALPFILIVASLLGSIIGIGMIATQKADRQTHIPFGPFAAVAAWITFVWGKDIINFYLQFIGVAPIF